MAIYRGTGVTGTGGESDFAQLVQDAEAAAAAAQLAETNAETAEANAELAETNAETAATNAANSASAASTSASNAASSATAASNSASTATTQATNAANSATAAATSASNAATSATNAANSATSASTSASTATTQATNAANSATAAASSASSASTSATNAASSASTATTQATNAANSATAAATSATNASNSASAAATSATNAANSATSASTSATSAAASAAEAAATVTSKVSKSGDTMTGPLIVNSNTSTDALRITQTGSGNALVVEDSANPDSSPFVIDANGKALVGYTTSVPVLGVSPAIQLFAADGYFSQGRYTNDAFASWQLFTKSRNTTIGSQTIVNSGDDLGVTAYLGSDGASFIRAAQIAAQVDGTPGTNDMPGRLVFSTTADGASTPTERMRITNAGGVGVGGTPASNQRLLIAGSGSLGANPTTLLSQQTLASDATGTAIYFDTYANTAAASFTLTNMNHYRAYQGTIGSGSAVTSQRGFLAESTLTGATNNYGVFSNIASGTGRWNFYAAGSADNYFAGRVGIGANPNFALDIGNGDISIKRSASSTGALYFGGLTNEYIYGDATNKIITFATNNTERMRIDSSGNLIHQAPTTAPTLSTNGTMVFNLTSNTNLRVSVRGSDGVTRTANITLA